MGVGVRRQSSVEKMKKKKKIKRRKKRATERRTNWWVKWEPTTGRCSMSPEISLILPCLIFWHRAKPLRNAVLRELVEQWRKKNKHVVVGCGHRFVFFVFAAPLRVNRLIAEPHLSSLRPRRLFIRPAHLFYTGLSTYRLISKRNTLYLYSTWKLKNFWQTQFQKCLGEGRQGEKVGVHKKLWIHSSEFSYHI